MSILIAQNLQRHLDGLLNRNQPWPRPLGILYGFTTSTDVIALMCAFFEESLLQDTEALRAFLEQNNHILPTGLDVVGLFDLSESLKSHSENFSKFLNSLSLTLGMSKAKEDLFVLVLHRNLEGKSDSGVRTSGYRVKTGAFQEIPVSIRSNESLQRFYSCFHLNAQLDSALTPIHSKHGALKALELKLLELQMENRNDFAYGLQENFLFLLPSIPPTVVSAGNIGGSLVAGTKIQDLLCLLSKKKGKTEVKRGVVSLSDATGGLLPDDPISLKLFQNSTDAKSQHGSSPLLTIGQGSTHLIRFCLDTYLFLSNEKSLSDLLEAAELSKKRRLAGMVEFLRKSAAVSSKAEQIFRLPLPYHVVNGPNILTLLFAPGGNDETHFDDLYTRFGYEDNLPVMRKEASLRSRLLLSKRNLLNVGEKLVSQQSKFLDENQAWHLSRVLGSYTYHHYKQDRFDDDGWGCAYRSLQTLFSWFKLQGFTDLPIPNHEQIQRILVEIKDREKSLIGSRQWIGATEIARVLDHLLQVQCRIVNVPSGRDLGSAFASLRNHFETEGSPVMIGGGVYAYTIGGVAVNRTSGEVKALVIDPHYVGDDEMDLVFKKNGVAWRTPDFWDQSAFYNLCCPLRPKLRQE